MQIYKIGLSLQIVKFTARIFCCLAALGAAACNDGAFIEEFLPEAPSVTLDAQDSRFTVEFEAGNWNIDYATGSAAILSGTAFDAEGNELGSARGFEGLGKLVYETDSYSFDIVRRAPDRLEIVLVENLEDEAVKIEITVGNEIETEKIRAMLQPTPKYEIDRVEFDWQNFQVYDERLMLVDSFTVDNSGSGSAATVSVTPFRDAAREIVFTDKSGSSEYDFKLWFGEPLPKVRIPDVSDGKPVPQGPEVEFGSGPQKLGCGLDPGHIETVEIGAGLVREVHVYLITEEYRVPYTIHATNPFNGRVKTSSGTLSSTRPYDCFVIALEKTGQ